MDVPDPKAVTQVNVDDPEVEGSADLDGLGLSLNNATRDAWIALSDALSEENDLESIDGAVRPAPHTDLRAVKRVVGAGIGESLDDEESGPLGSACVVLFLAEPMTTQEAIGYVAAAYKVDALAADEAYVRLVHTPVPSAILGRVEKFAADSLARINSHGPGIPRPGP